MKILTTKNNTKNDLRQLMRRHDEEKDYIEVDELGLPTREYMDCMSNDEMQDWIDSVDAMIPDDAFDFEW